MNNELTLDAVRSFTKKREVDLTFATPPYPFELALHGQFDCYGDYFTILARGVIYADVVTGLAIGDMTLFEDFSQVFEMAPKWSYLKGELDGGPCLVIRSADADTWQSATAKDLHVIVADELRFRPGADWERMASLLRG